MKALFATGLALIIAAIAVFALRPADSTPTTGTVTTTAAMLPDAAIHVVKSRSCGCCGQWVDHLNHHAFSVTTEDVDDVSPFKQEAGITPALASCHTAFVDGYVIEGHVPAKDIRRLLTEKPDALGLTVPGMPIGSPGMEIEGRPADPYDVLLIHRDGSTSVFAHHGS